MNGVDAEGPDIGGTFNKKARLSPENGIVAIK